MAENQLKQLREKLEQQEKQFQSYRQQCRNLQNFLEGESTKKQQQIRKLKEEAITKQRQFKALKIENTSLVNEISHLKSQVNRMSNDHNRKQEGNKAIQGLEQLNKELAAKNRSLAEELRVAREESSRKDEEAKLKTDKIGELQAAIISSNHNLKETQQKLQLCLKTIQQQRQQIEQLQSRKVHMENLPTTSPKERAIVTAKKINKKEQIPRNDQDEKLKKYEDKIQRYEKQIKELKEKLQASKSNSNSNSPSKMPKEDEQSFNPTSKIFIACYVLTKQYYLSPIVQLKTQAKLIKLFKSSRNGCFEKCLGATKHKVDILAHESNSIVKEITERITKCEQQCNHSILIYGVKKSNKKQIMGAILTKLFNFLSNKIQNENSQDLSAIFIKKIPDEENSLQKEQADNSQDILDLLEKAANVASSQPKKQDKSQSLRRPQKPRIYYFSVRVNDFSLQVATSSFTNINYREKQIITTFYNNVLYSKLPDILQPSYSQKYIVLTLNPIVDLYDECRNTLSVTQYKMPSNNSLKDQQGIQGFNKEFFSEMARRKLEGYEKEIQQNLVKIKKVEEESQYFKSKFDQLQSRLKILLSTHHGQSSYLKKSPILLSYEKLLKFVHAVQSKNSTSPQIGDIMCPTLRINAIDFDFNDSDSNDEAL